MLDAYPSDLQALVQQKIACGEFKSADDFAVQAARVYLEIDRRHRELKQSVTDAIAALEAGDYLELKDNDELRQFAEDVKRRGRERLRSAPAE